MFFSSKSLVQSMLHGKKRMRNKAMKSAQKEITSPAYHHYGDHRKTG